MIVILYLKKQGDSSWSTASWILMQWSKFWRNFDRFKKFDFIEKISKKLKSRSKKLKIVYDAIEVLESNLIRAEEFLKNN